MNIPKHVAIIPDGNRRWAKAHRLNPWEGHAEGVKRFWDVADELHSLGVHHATFWAGSYDNLKKRSEIEVNFLMELLRQELANPQFLEKLLKDKVQFRVIGEWKDFVTDKSTIAAIEAIEKQTANFDKKALTILFAYDGQREMIAAANAVVGYGEKIDGDLLRSKLWTAQLPDVDLVVRTGGEPHWSAGFMMWHSANSQFYFTDLLWPDFEEKQIKTAIEDFDRRERRLGK